VVRKKTVSNETATLQKPVGAGLPFGGVSQNVAPKYLTFAIFRWRKVKAKKLVHIYKLPRFRLRHGRRGQAIGSDFHMDSPLAEAFSLQPFICFANRNSVVQKLVDARLRK